MKKALLVIPLLMFINLACGKPAEESAPTPVTVAAPPAAEAAGESKLSSASAVNPEELKKKRTEALAHCEYARTKNSYALCRATIQQDLNICDETKLKDTYGLCRAVVSHDPDICEETRLKDTYALCRAWVKKDLSICEDTKLKDTYALCRAIVSRDKNICEEVTLKDSYAVCNGVVAAPQSPKRAL